VAVIIPVLAIKVVSEIKTATVDDQEELAKWNRMKIGVTCAIWVWGAAATAISSVPHRCYPLDQVHIYNICHGHVPMTADVLAVAEGFVDGGAGICGWAGGSNGKEFSLRACLLFILCFGATCMGLVSSLLSLKEFQPESAIAAWYAGLGFFLGATACRADLWRFVAQKRKRDTKGEKGVSGSGGSAV
jgi:hypothetical protein